MACFITPLALGIVVSAVSRLWRRAEGLKLGALSYLLLGGSVILAVEHAWHGEVVPYPPFLTAASDVVGMIGELTRVGGSMSLASVGLWLSILYASKWVELRRVRPAARATTTLGA